MKTRIPLSLFLFMTAALMLSAFPVHAATYDLSLETTSNGTTPQTQFASGSSIYLNIDLTNSADAQKIAGSAFTLVYPAAVVDPPALNTTDGIPVTATDIQSFFPFVYGAEKTHRIGSRTGELLFSGAAIDGATGGATNHPSDQNLFTVKFTVKSGAASGNYSFSLKQTTLTNSNAGWNGEAVPILVGAVPSTDPNFNNLSGGAFPVLKQSFPVEVATSFTIGFPAGDVSGDGKVTSVDALMILQFLAGNNPPMNGVSPDINKNGSVTSVDALMILQYLAGNLSSLP